MQTERNQYFDYLKGIAILMVIGIHTFLGGGFDSFHDYLNIGIRQVLNCAVPVFIACSGFFLAKKNLANKHEINCFYKKQISRVYLPCLLWSIPWFLLNLLSGHSVMMETINLLFCGYSVFYFVILMIQYYLLLPLTQRFNQKCGGGGIISILHSLQPCMCGSCNVYYSYQRD